MQPDRLFPRIAITLTCLLSCELAPRVATTDVTPRQAVRVEAVGCWALRASATGISLAESLRVQLDTVVAMGETAHGVRVVHRLDDRGHALLRDAEGFATQDRWTADARSDSVRLVFNNGLQGSFWALALPARATPSDTLHGVSQGFGDVVPAPAYPSQVATAIRIRCGETNGGAAGA